MTTTIDTFTIGGLDYRAYADVTSLNISEGLAINTDTMSVDIVLDSVTFTSGDVPRPISGHSLKFVTGQPPVIYDIAIFLPTRSFAVLMVLFFSTNHLIWGISCVVSDWAITIFTLIPLAIASTTLS